MDIADLKVFEAVARCNGINRAASELHTVQSNVTTRIRGLEEELGVQLFVRHSKGVVLTDAGARLIPFAQRAAQLLREAKLAVRETDTPSGSLTLGSLESTAMHRLSSLVATYGRLFPDVDVTLRTAPNARLIEDVMAYRVEGAFVCGPVDGGKLAQRVAFREELVVATAVDVESLEELVRDGSLKIVVKAPGCAYRETFESVLQRRGIAPRPLEFGTLEAIMNCVASGLGATLLPRSVLEASSPAGRLRLHAIPETRTPIDTLFVYPRDMYLSGAFRAFLSLLEVPALAIAAE